MLSEKMVKALNEQIHEELYSFYLYMAMAEYCREEKLDGFAKWLHLQAKEELSHGMKLMHYVAEQGGRVELKGLATPPKSWKTPHVAFQEVLKHEQHITSCIYKLVDLAVSIKDHATHGFLGWFVNEQVEEESNANRILDQMEMLAKHPAGLYMLDREMARREG